jgi:hypothetical protein
MNKLLPFYGRKLKERYYFEYGGVTGRITLLCIFKK